MGGLEKNKHRSRKLNAGRGGVGKFIVVGAKERHSTKIKAQFVGSTKQDTLHGFFENNVEPGSIVNTDDFRGFKGLYNYQHQFVRHSVGEYVNEMAHINGIENF